MIILGMIKKLGLMPILSALLLATLASAQTPLTYTAPTGTVHCLNKAGQLPAVNHGCVIRGLVGASGTQTASFATQGLSDGSDYVVFRIDPGQPPYEEVVNAHGTWAPLASLPDRGVPVLFSFDASIIDVCLAECGTASGSFHLEGEFSWQYKVSFVCGRQCFPITYQDWVNTSPVVVTILDQSTVAILD